jgi:hypothetical protein
MAGRCAKAIRIIYLIPSHLLSLSPDVGKRRAGKLEKKKTAKAKSATAEGQIAVLYDPISDQIRPLPSDKDGGDWGYLFRYLCGVQSPPQDPVEQSISIQQELFCSCGAGMKVQTDERGPTFIFPRDFISARKGGAEGPLLTANAFDSNGSAVSLTAEAIRCLHESSSFGINHSVTAQGIYIRATTKNCERKPIFVTGSGGFLPCRS